MIRHIVLFKMKPFETEGKRIEKLTEIKSGLENLRNYIPELQSIEAGINVNSSEQYDLSLVCTVNNMDDLNVYAKHPKHLAVGSIIRKYLESRSCVDAEF